MSLVMPFNEIFNGEGLLAAAPHWERVELRDLVTILNGFPLKSSLFSPKDGFPIIRIRDLKFNTVQTYYTGDFPCEYVVENGDLLVGMDGDFICYEWTGGKAVLNQRVCKLIPNEKVLNKRFLFYAINGYLGAIHKVTSSVTVKHLSSLDILKIPFPVPPLEEQRRSVAKLDDLVAKVNNSKTCLERIPTILKKFRQGIITAAVSGELTSAWRGRNNTEGKAELLLSETLKGRKKYWLETEIQKYSSQGKVIDEKKIQAKYKEPNVPSALLELPEGWTTCNWNQISNWVTYGFTRPMPDSDNGIPKITVKHVRRGMIDFGSCEFTTEEAFKKLNPKDKPLKGDILITKDGATLGRSAIVDTDAPFCIGQSVAVVWLRSTEINRKFLHYVIESKSTQKVIWDVARGMGMPHLSITDFMAISFGLPSLEEQNEIVRRVEELFHFADSIEARYQKAKAWFDKIPQALLTKAFRGELVPQDERDEPASVLLERVRQEKLKAELVREHVRMRKGKKVVSK